MASSESSIEAIKLTKEYDSFTALDNLNLRIEGAKCVGFLGPNGAGKTTTVSMLCCLISKTSGEARIVDYDVDWQAAVHAKRKNCSGEVFEWDERGTEMKSIHLTCQACGEMSTLADVYFRHTACSGRFPEGKDYEPCDEDMYVILKNASNLRIAEIVSAITVPPRVTRLHTILQDPLVFGLVTSGERWSKSELLRGLEAQVKRRVIPPKYIDEVRQIDETQILTAIDEVLDFKGVPDEIELKEKEFRALRHAAENGAKYGGPGNRSYFEVDKSKVARIPLGSRLHLRVCPIRTLRTVLAQRGYRRHIRGEGRLVERFLSVGQDRWYPGL